MACAASTSRLVILVDQSSNSCASALKYNRCAVSLFSPTASLSSDPMYRTPIRSVSLVWTGTTIPLLKPLLQAAVSISRWPCVLVTIPDPVIGSVLLRAYSKNGSVMYHLFALYIWHHSGRHPIRKRWVARLAVVSPGWSETNTYDSPPSAITSDLTHSANSESSSAAISFSKRLLTSGYVC